VAAQWRTVHSGTSRGTNLRVQIIMTLVPSFWTPCQVLGPKTGVRTAPTVDSFMPSAEQRAELWGKSSVLPPTHFQRQLLTISLSATCTTITTWTSYRIRSEATTSQAHDVLPPVPAHRRHQSAHHPAQNPFAHRLNRRNRQGRADLLHTSLHTRRVHTPGASKFCKGGLTLYTLPSRIAFGGWTEHSLKNYKGPTLGVVLGLARHNKPLLGVDWVLEKSGTARPTRTN